MACLALLSSGCSQQLFGSLDEMAANQVVSALRREGVSADKAPAGDKGWRVTVADAQFADAVQIIERRNLPSPQFQGLGQVFKKESLVSTPTEERARLMYAMSQELEHSLMEIDGVLAARVHPVILAQDPLSPKRTTATASVLIKYRVGTDVSGRDGMVRALVAAGIEGLAPDDVRVVMIPADAPVGFVDRPVEPAPGGTLSSAVRAAWRGVSPAVAASVAVGVAALLLLSLAWTRWRASAARSLRGRWQHTVNSLFLDRETPSVSSQRRRSEQFE